MIEADGQNTVHKKTHRKNCAVEASKEPQNSKAYSKSSKNKYPLALR